MFNFKIVSYENLDESFSNSYHKDIYTTLEWLNYLKKAMNIEPVVIEIFNDEKFIGYFVGGIFRKFGIRIIGSPFNGWNTPYMGFVINEEENINRIDIVLDLWKFLKKEYKILYAEICDKYITEEEIKEKKYKYIVGSTYTLIIDKSEEELLSGFTKHCRKNLRLFNNRGATIVEEEYTTNYLNEFYPMLQNVFAHQGLVPPYSKEKLSDLFSTIKSENILCIKALNPGGKCIGMSVSFGYGDNCYAFASATDRNENYNQKNYLRWYAILYWKKQNKKFYDLMGVRNYKTEFNPNIEYGYRIILSKYKLLFLFRNIAKKAYWIINKLKFSHSQKK